MIAKRTLAALVAVGILAAACVSDSKQATPETSQSPSARSNSTPTPATGNSTSNGCPVDREICDFAVGAEAAIQHGDPSAIASPSSKWFPDAADPAGIGAVILGQLEGGTRPRVVGIECGSTPSGTPCGQTFALVFDALPPGQERPAPPKGLMAVLWFQRASTMPLLVSLSADQSAVRPGVSLAFDSSRYVPSTAPAPVSKLKKVDDVPFPAGYSIVFATGGYAHGHGGYFLVERVYRDSSGQLRRETLFDPKDLFGKRQRDRGRREGCHLPEPLSG